MGTLTFSLRQFGVRKGSLKRRVYSDCEQTNHPEVFSLLARRGDRYTGAELLVLVQYLTTSHTDCVLDHADEFHPLAVANAKAAERRRADVERAVRAAIGGTT